MSIKQNRQSTEKGRTLTIRWQRLEIEGETCPRCGSTESELEKAAKALEKTLAPKGLTVRLEKMTISKPEFDKNPHESNRIWINGQTLEEILGADTGASECCSVCGPKKCRTVTYAGKTHESIPAELIAKAGVRVASTL